MGKDTGLELDPAITAKWDSGELGRSMEHAAVAPAAEVVCGSFSAGVPMAKVNLVRESEPDVFVEVVCKTTGADGVVPRWARVKFTRELVDTLLRMEQVRADNRLDRVAVRRSPDEYGPCDDEKQLRTESAFLVVGLFGSSPVFRFDALERYTGAVMESSTLFLPQVFACVADGVRYFGVTMSADELQAEVEGSTAEPSEAA